MKNQGYLHIYCGEGKGKTSILNGMVLRALGANKKVLYIRFLKNRETSENKILEKIGVPVHSFYYSSTKFVWEMDDQEKAIFASETQQGYHYLIDQLHNPEWDVIFVDEVLGAIQNQFIDQNDFINQLNNRLPHLEIVLSGRYSYPELDEIADLISEVKLVKHYFEKKVASRKGIEF